MKSFVLAIVALATLSFASSVNAQAPQPNPVRLALAREILTANGGAQAAEAQLRAVFTSAANLSKGALTNADPKISEISQVVMQYMIEEEVKAIPELIDQTAAAYANNLSERELHDLLAWSTSPSGQAIRLKSPAIMQEVIATQGPLMKKMMAGATATAIEHACAQSRCSTEERRIITGLMQKAAPQS